MATKNLENIKEDVHVYVTEIFPPFGRLNDIKFMQSKDNEE